jgi:formylglycine-generating enzyme required for sulfatase activity
MSTALLEALKDHLDLGESPENVKLAWSGAADDEKTEFFDLLLMEALLMDTLTLSLAQTVPAAPRIFTHVFRIVGVAALLMIAVGFFWLWQQRSGYREPQLVVASTETGGMTSKSPRRGEPIQVGPAGARLTMGGYCDLALAPGTQIILRGEPCKEAVELITGRVVSEITPQEGEYTVYTPLGWVKVKGTRFTTTVESPAASTGGVGTRTPESAVVTVGVALGEVEYRLGKESGVLRAGETRLFAQAPPAKSDAPPAPGVQAQAKPELPKTLSLPIGNGVKMDFVLIQPGTFVMGREKGESWEKHEHQVAITKPFYMGVYEVTQAQWKAVMANNPCTRQGDDLPVVEVSWEDCQTFLEQLNEKFGEAATFRLPTEAEWEYACRAGSKTLYSFGDDEAALVDYAWYEANSMAQLQPVGQKKPNAWGLYDMHGNVTEFCADWLSGPYPASAAIDPVSTPTGNQRRVVRGGSWLDKPARCRSAARGCLVPSVRWGNSGLRLACTPADAR